MRMYREWNPYTLLMGMQISVASIKISTEAYPKSEIRTTIWFSHIPGQSRDTYTAMLTWFFHGHLGLYSVQASIIGWRKWRPLSTLKKHGIMSPQKNRWRKGKEPDSGNTNSMHSPLMTGVQGERERGKLREEEGVREQIQSKQVGREKSCRLQTWSKYNTCTYETVTAKYKCAISMC